MKSAARHPLPEWLFKAIDSVKGNVYLWERFAVERCALRDAQGNGHSGMKAFSVKRLYSFVGGLFSNFQQATGRTLSSHDLRRRAATKLYQLGYRVEQIAEMMGVSVQTLLKHYLDPKKTVDADELRRAEGTLIPPA